MSFITTLAAVPLLVLLALQLLVTADIRYTLQWIFQQPSAFVFSYFFVFFFHLLVFAASRSRRWAFIITGFVFCFIGVVSFYKKASLGQPLYPTDFMIISAVGEIGLALFSKVLFRFALGFLLALGLVYLLSKWARKENLISFPAKLRISVGLIAVIGLCVLTLRNNPLHDHLFANTFKVKQSQLPLSFKENGLIVSFIALVEKGILRPLLTTLWKRSGVYMPSSKKKV